MMKIEHEENLINRKKKEYKNYIEEHVNNVSKAFEELYNKINDQEIIDFYDELLIKVGDHDASKYSEEEFDAYRKNFYPINDQEKEENKEEFDKAWEHHYKVNDHHWQHWLNGEELKPFDEQNLKELKLAYLEMVLDWTAMGYKFGDTAYDYYMSHKNEIKLYPELEDWIIDIMKQLKGED